MNDQRPISARPILPHDAAMADSAALGDLVALDLDDGVLENRVCHLNAAGGVLGGQIAAHMLMAGAQGKPGFLPSALHLVFASAPDRTRAWQLEAEAVRDGRRFGQRMVSLRQGGQTMAHGSVVLKAEAFDAELTINHSPPMPEMPPPDSLPTRDERQILEDLDEFRLGFMRSYPFMDLREIPADASAHLPPPPGARAYFWLRMPMATGLDQIVQQALLTLASDFWYALPVQMLAVKEGIDDPILSTSLDHCVWFHSHVDCSEWMLFETEATVASEGTALKRAMVWSRDGRPLITVNQQCMARVWSGSFDN